MGLQQHNCEMPRVFVSLPGFFHEGADFDRFPAREFDGTNKGRGLGSGLDLIMGKMMVRVCF